MTQYRAHIIPNPLGNLEEFIKDLSEKEQHHGLVSAIIDEIEQTCSEPIRSKDAYDKMPKSFEVHFIRVYSLGFPFRGIPFALVCLVVNQDDREVHLLGGWLCETDEETARPIETALERARQWASGAETEAE